MHKVLFVVILLIGLSCSTTSKVQKATADDTAYQTVYNPEFAIMQWEQQTVDLGIVKLGDTRNLEYAFTNVGKAALEIELVTTCKCTSIDWPRTPILPGEKGIITVTYDSTGQQLGKIKKTLDIIANTDPIVVEAFFTVEVVE